MTENKRFTVRYSNANEYDNIIQDNGKILRDKEVLDLLNNLAEENEYLKQENEKLKDYNEHYEQWFKNEEIKEVVVGDMKVIFE